MKLARLSVLLLALACSSNDPPGGGPADAGPRTDAGDGEDAGPDPDAGTGDAGPQDGGSNPDAGPEDGGADAGPGGTDGGGCVAPAPIPGTLLASGLNNPRRLAVDSSYVYVSETHQLNPQQDPGQGRLLRIPRSGGAAEPLATGFRVPDAIAVDDTSVYVLAVDGLWRVNKATGDKGTKPIETTVNNVTVGGTELALGRTNGRDVVVIATSHRRLVRVDVDGASPQLLFDGGAGTQVRGARLVDGALWFLVTGGSGPPATKVPGLYRVPLDGSAEAELMNATVTAGTSLTVTPTHFLITDGALGAGRVLKLPRASGPAEVVARGLQGPLFPVEWDGAVYFKETTASSADFLRSTRGCEAGTSAPVGPAGTGPGGLLLDGATLFYTSAESGTGGTVGQVP